MASAAAAKKWPRLSQCWDFATSTSRSRQSPDGKLFLSWVIDRIWETQRGVPAEDESPPRYMIRLGRMAGGATRVIAPDGNEQFAWSPDSKRFAYTVYERPPEVAQNIHGRVRSTQVRLVGVDGINEMTVLWKSGQWHIEDWSPDGKKLLLQFSPAAFARYGTQQLVEYDLASAMALKGRIVPHFPGQSWASSESIERCLTVLTGGEPYNSSFTDARYSPDGKRLATITGGELAVLDLGTSKPLRPGQVPGGLARAYLLVGGRSGNPLLPASQERRPA